MEFDLSILIVEDDYSFALELRMLLEEIGYQINKEVDNSEAALTYIASSPPDLIIMDINIKGAMTGIELAESIYHLSIPILYITSFGDRKHYDLAKETNLIAYLVKPIDEYTLRSSIQLAIHSLSQQANMPEEEEKYFPFENKIFFKDNGIYKKIDINSILYIESDGDYRFIHDLNKRLMISMSLNELESMLEDHGFNRVHRSYLINLNAIDTINTDYTNLTINQKVIPISRSKKAEIKELFKML